MLTFDHIAVATADLAKGTAEIAKALGVPLEPGGKHAHFGTHNTLLNLGDIYLEVIAKDPNATTERPTWFGLDHFTGPTRPANWICRTDDFSAAPSAVGKPVALSRGDLRWELTVPEDGSLPWNGAYPSLLKWAKGTVPPAQSLPDRGCRLRRWTILHPDADSIDVPIDDPRIYFETSTAPGFRAEIETPSGLVTLT